MRLEAVFGPYSCNPHMRDIAQRQRQFATAPVRGAIRWFSLCCPLKNARLLSFAALTGRSAAMARVQTGQALGNKSALPPSNKVGVAVQLVANRSKPFAIGEQQNQPSPSRLRCVSRLPSYPSIQLLSFGWFQSDYVHQTFRRFSCVTIH